MPEGLSRIVILMGVAGSGKTTVGRSLASALGWPFADGDDYHPRENVAKMRSGEPLGDVDREPWLRALADAVAGWLGDGQSTVLACSALKARYRQMLTTEPGRIHWVYLRGTPELLRARLVTRSEHFMPAGLLDSQLAALEEPQDALVLEASAAADALARQIVERLALRPSRAVR